MPRRNAFTLVELLVVIAIIAVLLAILLPSLRIAKNLAQRLTCQAQLKDTGISVSNYAGQYDGRMPKLLRDKDGLHTGDGRYTHAHYIYAELDAGVTYYGGPGALWKAGLVPDGRQFYCKAVQGWLDEYRAFCDPTPWGTLPQNSNTGFQCIFAYKGYFYWPQSRYAMKQTEWDSITWGNLKSMRLELGKPTAPYLHADLSPQKAMMIDWAPHSVRGSGYNVNALFGDGHVVLHPLPKDTNGKYFQCYQSTFIKELDPPYGASLVPVNGNQYWTAELPIATYMMKFQP
jgi:prepilin-type N-terminal cleavage/methylation domain-containing protein/prepilin-type processing-associated H-X9-DG protein